RVADAPHTGHRPGSSRRAVHHRRVELVAARRVEHRAAPRIEQRIVLEHDDRGGNGVEAAAAAVEHRVAPLQRGSERVVELALAPLGHASTVYRAGAAVDDEHRTRYASVTFHREVSTRRTQ